MLAPAQRSSPYAAGLEADAGEGPPDAGPGSLLRTVLEAAIKVQVGEAIQYLCGGPVRLDIDASRQLEGSRTLCLQGRQEAQTIIGSFAAPDAWLRGCAVVGSKELRTTSYTIADVSAELDVGE